MLLEGWAGSWDFDVPIGEMPGRSLVIKGSKRAYLARQPLAAEWSSAKYDRLRLLGKTLQWTVDLSRVGPLALLRLCVTRDRRLRVGLV